MRFKKTSRPVLIAGMLTIPTMIGSLFIFPGTASAQVANPPLPTSGRDPGSSFRPLGSASAVDRYRQPPMTDPAVVGSGVQQTAFMQSDDFSMPPSGAFGLSTTPPSGTGAAPPVTSRTAPPVNATTPPSMLQNGPTVRGQTSGLSQPPPPGSGSPSDLRPVAQPSINGNWSTTNNNPMVTGPSNYRAEFDYCAPGMNQLGPLAMVPPSGPYAGGPYAVVPPTVPPNSPQALSVYPTRQNSIGPPPLISLGQDRNNVQLGQGIIGQPVAYVPGQYFRNFLRYLAP